MEHAYVASGTSGLTGQRLYAIGASSNPALCDFVPSSPLANFDRAGISISASGIIYADAVQAVVAARFDGLAWNAQAYQRPGQVYRGAPVLLAPTASGQPLLMGTGAGFVDELLAPPPSNGTSLPTAPTETFSSSAAPLGFSIIGTTVGKDGTITVATEDLRIVALDPAGKQKWATTLPGRPTVAPTHGVDGTLYAVDESGTLSALSIVDGSVKWTFTAQAALRAAPILACDGTLYIGSDDGTVYALVSDSAGLADSPWPRAGRDNRGTADMRRVLRSPDGTCLE